MSYDFKQTDQFNLLIINLTEIMDKINLLSFILLQKLQQGRKLLKQQQDCQVLLQIFHYGDYFFQWSKILLWLCQKMFQNCQWSNGCHRIMFNIDDFTHHIHLIDNQIYSHHLIKSVDLLLFACFFFFLPKLFSNFHHEFFCFKLVNTFAEIVYFSHGALLDSDYQGKSITSES